MRMPKLRMPKSFRRKSKGEIVLHIFVSLIFFVVAASYVYVFLWAVVAGAKTHTEIVINPFSLPQAWHWEHYLEVFTLLEVNGHNFWDMLFNSVYFSVGAVALNKIVTMSFAYCCTKYKFPGSNLPYVIILVMMTLPLYGTGGATYRIYKALGMVDSYSHILSAVSGFSMDFLYFRACFKNMSWSYAEAAMMDGADDFVIYTKVMMPMARPLFGALFLTGWLGTWNNYESALIYLPNIPTLPVGIYQFNTEMMYRARLDILFAACVLISIPAIILFIAFNKVITTNVSLGGIKG